MIRDNASGMTPAGRGGRPMVAFQGWPGAFSHLACEEMLPGHTPLPCRTFAAAFNAVRQGEAEFAVIPIDNSIAGRVADVHHLLPDPGLYITGEHFLPIRLRLLALPGTRLGDIRRVCSHMHALNQCRQLIHRLGLETVDAGDTAGAARAVAASGDPSLAALSSARAGELYGLVTLVGDAGDNGSNTTRFVRLAPVRSPLSAGGEEPVMTSLLFRVRNIPAALYKALGGLATNGVNMLKLESYMTGDDFSVASFYTEIEGHPEDEHVACALEELRYFTSSLFVLGAYPQSPWRRRRHPAPAPATTPVAPAPAAPDG